MSELMLPLILASASVLVIAMLCASALRAWRGWLELKRLELRSKRAAQADDGDSESPAALIELASVKERLRRLEAIANGVEL
ncbi:MAG: hypothetical protein JWL74_998 [Alphaproteobacteria bacterium]|nr:hypothetical protein [Alphaproteobacteria bacterium]